MKIRNLIPLGILLLGHAGLAQAQFSYITYSGAITITGYTGTNRSVTIPTVIGALPVTGIDAFFSYTSLTNVTIPESVTNIASGAFAFSGSLTAIIVDDQNAYYSSSNGVLFDKRQAVLIEAPGGMTGNYTIPTNVVSLGASAFSFCTGLSGVTIPDSVTNIGSGAFNNCAELTQVVIGPNILNIGSETFANCQSLTAITVDGRNLQYSSLNGVLFDKPQWTLIQVPGGMTGAYAVPPGVTSLETGALESCSQLTEITLPDSVTNIGDQAFSNCSDLTNVTMSAGLVSIGDYVFASCPSLTDLTIPKGVTSIGEGTFEYCTSLTGIILSTNLASIGADAFQSCSSLAALVVPNSVTNLGSGALANCGGLTNLVLGTNIVSLGDAALQNCARLTTIALPGSVTSIGSSVFSGCAGLTSITVDEQNPAYSSIGGALLNKPQTTLIQVPGGWAGSYALPDSVTTVDDGALAGCGHLTAITVGAQNSFFTALNGVLFDRLQTTLIQFPGGVGGGYVVPDGVTSLGSTAFSGCSNLASITIPAAVTNVGSAAFANCSQAGIYFQGNAPAIASSMPGGIVTPFPIILGNGFYSPNSEAVYYLPGTTGWGMTFDGIRAYLWEPPYVCTPASNSITINGFNGSGGAVAIPDQINGLPVTAIASGALDNAAGLGLTNIILSANVTTIGSYAFAACANLTSITIPSGVTNLGAGAFAFCDNLKSVYFQGNAPSAGSGVFFRWSGFPILPPIYEPPTPTTIYYLPGATGWGTTFGGQPTVLWNPEVQTGDASFGLHADGFGFNITGTTNLTVVVEACTSLSPAQWRPVQTITLTTGSIYFIDPQGTNCPGRFYRLRSP